MRVKRSLKLSVLMIARACIALDLPQVESLAHIKCRAGVAALASAKVSKGKIIPDKLHCLESVAFTRKY